MADSTTHIAQVDSAQAQKEVTVNGLFDAASPAMFGGRRAEACAGLIWGYYGGRWGGTAVANGTLTLAAGATNYIVADRLTGAILLMDGSPDMWADTTNYSRLYAITTGASSVTSYADHRAGPGGVSGSTTPSMYLSDLLDVDTEGSPTADEGEVLTYNAGTWRPRPVPAGTGTAGRHSIPVMASSISPSAAGGCASITTRASAANMPDIITLDFDASTEEYAQFAIPMPKKWDLGTVTAKFIWRHGSTTTNFTVIWGLQAVAISNDDTFAASYGTAQTATDTGGTTDDLYVSPETSAITIAGTPAAEDVVCFRVYRKAADGADTLAIDAGLVGVVLYITTSAETDA